MLIQYIILGIIGLLVAVYILYQLYQMIWGKPIGSGCSSGSCKGCKVNKH